MKGIDYSLKLSEQHADAVADYLAKHGMAAERLEPHCYGITNFIATNDTKDGTCSEPAS